MQTRIIANIVQKKASWKQVAWPESSPATSIHGGQQMSLNSSSNKLRRSPHTCLVDVTYCNSDSNFLVEVRIWMIESFLCFCVHNQSSLCYEHDPHTRIWHHQTYNRSKWQLWPVGCTGGWRLWESNEMNWIQF